MSSHNLQRRVSVTSVADPPPAYTEDPPPYSEAPAPHPVPEQSPAPAPAQFIPAPSALQAIPESSASLNTAAAKSKEKPKSRWKALKEEQARHARSRYQYASSAEIARMRDQPPPPRSQGPQEPEEFERNPRQMFHQLHHEIRSGGRVQYASHAEIARITGRDEMGYKSMSDRERRRKEEELEKMRAQNAGAQGDCIIM